MKHRLFRLILSIAIFPVTAYVVTAPSSPIPATSSVSAPVPIRVTTVAMPSAPKPRVLSTPLEWRTSGPWVAYPDSTDPTRFLTGHEQRVFQCIRYHESRNHVRHDGGYQEGWYQFTLSTWDLAKPFIRGLAPTPDQASGDQQSQVAVWYYKRNHSWAVEWRAEQGECF